MDNNRTGLEAWESCPLEPSVSFTDGTGPYRTPASKVGKGRGLRYEHLTPDESEEKRTHPEVIGQIGMALKDAPAVFDRHDMT